LAYFWRKVPETKDRSLEEIERDLAVDPGAVESVPVRHWSVTEPRMCGRPGGAPIWPAEPAAVGGLTLTVGVARLRHTHGAAGRLRSVKTSESLWVERLHVVKKMLVLALLGLGVFAVWRKVQADRAEIDLWTEATSAELN
jgi:hypothetical protein